jgi:uncharacterized protein YdeI (YjbR/CyaY-like superfamily)
MCPKRSPAPWRGILCPKAAFEALAFTHRKEYARWVGDAKRQETRDRRVTRALEMLREGKKLR